MSCSRIIQDSDGEEDNFSDIVSSADPLHDQYPESAQPSDFSASTINNVQSNDTKLCQPQTLGSEVPHVNFDKFLVSSSGGDPATASSQRRREQRWIPSDDVNVSIG
jgi:hypothetical protein